MKQQRNFYEQYKQMFADDRLPAIQRLPLRSLGQEERSSNQKSAQAREQYPEPQNNRYLSKPWKLVENQTGSPNNNYYFAGNFKKRDYHDMYTLLRSDVSETPEQTAKGKRRNVIIQEGLRAAGVTLKKQGEDIFVPRQPKGNSFKDKLTETHIKFIFNQNQVQEASRHAVSVDDRRSKRRRELTDQDIKLNRSMEPASGAKGPAQIRVMHNVHRSTNQRPINSSISRQQISLEKADILLEDNNQSSEAIAVKQSQEIDSLSIDRLAMQFKSVLSEQGQTVSSLCAGLQTVRREMDVCGLNYPTTVHRFIEHADFIESLWPLYREDPKIIEAAFASKRRLASNLHRQARQKELKKILLL